MNTNPRQYELGILVSGTWRQWATIVGQDCYENIRTGAIQYAVPAGWEDVATDGWVVDSSKPWPQWRNARTGRIRRTDPNPPPPRTYLDKSIVAAHLQLVERSPESHEYLYRRVIAAVLKHFFTEHEGFDVLQEESRGSTATGKSRETVLKITARPGGSMYTYDYCLVESKGAGKSWSEAQAHLKKHCEGTDNNSKQVYGIVHIGLSVQFFSAKTGGLLELSGPLHIRNDVDSVTAILENMKRDPLPFQ